jgi:hypothetical protein
LQAESAKDFVTLLNNIKNPKPNKVNPRFKSAYVDLAELLRDIKAPLSKHNCALVQTFEVVEDKLYIVTKILHTSGDVCSVSTIPVYQSEAKHNTAVQQLGSDITYLKRYSIATILGISSDEDGDGNSIASDEPQGQQAVSVVNRPALRSLEEKPQPQIHSDKDKKPLTIEQQALLGHAKKVAECANEFDLDEAVKDWENSKHEWSDKQITWFKALARNRYNDIIGGEDDQ